MEEKMKKKHLIFLFIIIIFLFNCVYNNNSGGGGGDGDGDDDSINPIYRQYMREFVQNISKFSRTSDADFLVIPQNGNELLTDDGESNGSLVIDYINAINGVSREDLFYGYDNDDVVTPADEKDYMIEYLDLAENNGIEVLVADYCFTQSKMLDSYNKNASKNYISFAADHRELNNIPNYPVNPWNMNGDNITSLSEAKNFLYLINPENYALKSDFLNAIAQTNYDIIIIDLFFNGSALTSGDISQLKTKNNGGSRLVIAYMSIGEAEDYRYYWQAGWHPGNPEWLGKENPDWPGNYKVIYWHSDWQSIIYGNNSSYLKKIIDAEFDGVYLDLIDAFEYYE